jgi:hypothetical protein
MVIPGANIAGIVWPALIILILDFEPVLAGVIIPITIPGLPTSIIFISLPRPVLFLPLPAWPKIDF